MFLILCYYGPFRILLWHIVFFMFSIQFIYLVILYQLNIMLNVSCKVLRYFSLDKITVHVWWWPVGRSSFLGPHSKSPANHRLEIGFLNQHILRSICRLCHLQNCIVDSSALVQMLSRKTFVISHSLICLPLARALLLLPQ